MHTWGLMVLSGFSMGHPAFCAHSSSVASASGSGCRAMTAGLPSLKMPALAAAISCSTIMVHISGCSSSGKSQAPKRGDMLAS